MLIFAVALYAETTGCQMENRFLKEKIFFFFFFFLCQKIKRWPHRRVNSSTAAPLQDPQRTSQHRGIHV
jgi:hypothetical protein